VSILERRLRLEMITIAELAADESWITLPTDAPIQIKQEFFFHLHMFFWL
jgi:hypothetical protein